MNGRRMPGRMGVDQWNWLIPVGIEERRENETSPGDTDKSRKIGHFLEADKYRSRGVDPIPDGSYVTNLSPDIAPSCIIGYFNPDLVGYTGNIKGMPLLPWKPPVTIDTILGE